VGKVEPVKVVEIDVDSDKEEEHMEKSTPRAAN
jgi:hypothetical protein